MCSNERTTSTTTPPGNAPPPGIFPYPLAALKQLNDASSVVPTPAAGGPNVPAPGTLLPLDHYRLQLYNYAMAERLRFSQHLAHPYPAPLPLCPGYPPYGPRLALSMSFFHHRALQPEEPKPQHSYIGLIAMAILSSPETKLVLSDIYQYILDNYPYFRSRGPGWRNSIRHNLSLNDCFIKAGRSANGKGHYWAIHPANVEDFKKGDFRRRKAQRKVRKHMGLAVDEDGGDSPSPPPVNMSPPPTLPTVPGLCWGPAPGVTSTTTSLFPSLSGGVTRKRQFDVASLLAPDDDDETPYNLLTRKFPRRIGQSYFSSGEEDNEDIDVVTSDQDVENPKEEVKVEGGEGSRQEEEEAPMSGLQRAPQSPLLSTWSQIPQHLALQQSVMFPGGLVSMEQQLMSRYYEQLAVQQHRRLLQHNQLVCTPSPSSGANTQETSDA
uniref:Fork-head domain-containing protein n=1 Tax=Timema bartmani TaxID=61472 RepID=A0A7R9I6H3_9NEOP|nr:unnamed protein product [Timema bartmani]